MSVCMRVGSTELILSSVLGAFLKSVLYHPSLTLTLLSESVDEGSGGGEGKGVMDGSYRRLAIC